MAEVVNGGRWQLDLKTLALMVTMVASIGGTWAVMGERIGANTEATKELKNSIIAIDTRQDAADRELSRLTAQVERLRDDIVELRRQSGLRTTVPR